MISNKMKSLVSSNSTIRAMFEEGKRLAKIHGEENVFDFSLGNPSVAPPETLKDTISEILDTPEPHTVHGYMNNSGYEQVREAIANKLNTLYNLNLSLANIVMTCGAAGGLNVTLKTLLNPGDDVIVFSPFFSEYRNYIANFDSNIVISKHDTETLLPDLAAFEESITPNTKAVLINSPNNPSGVIYKEDIIQSLCNILEQKQKEFGTTIYLISDEPYRELVYDNVQVPYILNYYANSIVCYSYSKSLSLPGERIGYLAVSNDIEDFEETMYGLNIANRILGFVNAPSLFQKVIEKSLDHEVDVSIYKRNRDLLYNHLVSLGFECPTPEGTFYLFPKSLIEDDVAFCAAAKEFNLLMVPGSAFGAPGHFRLSYCISYDKIERSLEAFTALANKFKN